MAELVLSEQLAPGVTLLTLNRPEKRNALSLSLMEQLCESIKALEDERIQRVLILNGAGKAFCSGKDLKEAIEDTENHTSAKMIARLLLTVGRTRLITIAAVHGAAVAGGAGLMTACDLIVAEEKTKFAYTEVRRGLVPALVSTFLRRQISERHLRELLFTGSMIDADRALRIGLVNRVVTRGKLLDEASNLAGAIMRGSPKALAGTKRIIEELGPATFEEDLERELGYHLQARNTDEASEGIAAYLEKRPPKWVPR